MKDRERWWQRQTERWAGSGGVADAEGAGRDQDADE